MIGVDEHPRHHARSSEQCFPAVLSKSPCRSQAARSLGSDALPRHALQSGDYRSRLVAVGQAPAAGLSKLASVARLCQTNEPSSRGSAYGVFELLRQHYIDLEYRNQPGLRQFRRAVKALSRGRLPSGRQAFSSCFEFSALPADGGAVVQYSEAPLKIVTFVVSILKEAEWKPAFGGGTDVNRPTDPRLCYNDMNRLADFEEMEVLHTCEFTSNRAVIFVKTANSWHSVRPMTDNGSNVLCRTLTINIEKTS
jgi:hypothetical protein